jgi:hypothetical protein
VTNIIYCHHNEQAEHDKIKDQGDRQSVNFENSQKQKCCNQFNQRILPRNFAFASPATPAKGQKTPNWEHVIPSQLATAGKTLGSAIDGHAGVVSIDHDIEKTADARPEKKEEQ